MKIEEEDRLASAPAWEPGIHVWRHSLLWLTVACFVGLLLQVLQLFPEINDLLGALSYGRWYPVHTNAVLYGWCALPLTGLLLRWFWPSSCSDGASTHVRLSLTVWSIALSAGAFSWLAGMTSSKPFMEWSGWLSTALPLAMLVLWVVLASWTESSHSALSAVELRVRCLALLALFVVPLVFHHAASPNLYPPINPDSGGATGTSLLGSTLGIIAIYGVVPHLLGLPRNVPGRNWQTGFFWAAWLGSMLIFLSVSHGPASHHDAWQDVLLGLLFPWAPLAWIHFRTFQWPTSARLWLIAGFCWWCLLLSSGWAGFLPGVSEHFKFTQLLVAHAHLAMAGCVTSLCWVILLCLGGTGRAPGPATIGMWQGATVLHVAATALAGWREIEVPGAVYLGDFWIQTAWFVRLVAGAILFLTALSWFLSALLKQTSAQGQGTS